MTRSERGSRTRPSIVSIVVIAVALLSALAVAAVLIAAPPARTAVGTPGPPRTPALQPAEVVTVVASVAATPSTEASVLVRPAVKGPSGRPGLVNSVPAAGKRVALTFDLCEREDEVTGYDKRIIDILLEREVPATFFMGGKWAQSHPDEARFLGSQHLFEIGNHSWTHIDMKKASPTEIDEQVERAQEAIAERTGTTPVLFRLPFGFGTRETIERIGEHGLWTIQWDVVTGDPDKNFHTREIMMQVKERVDDGSIIIMHANGRGWHTAEALPTVLDYLEDEGYEIVTVGELLSYR